jgi:hypothetical protein
VFDNLFGWAGSLLDTLRGLFSHIFDYIKRTVIPFIIRRYQAIEAHLNKYLGPVLRWVQRVRAWYFKHIFPIQHAILEVIARVRVALAIFRVLGFKWAAKLDADLQRLQSWVTASIQQIIGPLNLVQNYLSLMLDPAMILRKDFFTATLFSNLGPLKRAVGYGSNFPLTAEQQQRAEDNRALLDPAQPLATRNADGSYTYAPALAPMMGQADGLFDHFTQ